MHMSSGNRVGTRAKLSTLWIVVMMNMILADIFSIMVELVHKNTLDGMPGEVKMIMAIAAIITNVPILMIYLSRVLPYKFNRWTNIVAAVFTIIYVVGGASLFPHYYIIASIEVIVLLIIILKSWRWNRGATTEEDHVLASKRK
jgi:hypothetical protein